MTWRKGIVHWRHESEVYLSVAFTWHLSQAWVLSQWWRDSGVAVRAGGPAVSLMPNYLADVAKCGGELSPTPVTRHNPAATFTTRGCVRECAFCAVPRIEGPFRELEEWEPAPIVCDSNLTAASRAHFERVVARLHSFKGVDFNQGLDARLLQSWHLDGLTKLPLVKVRFSWDSLTLESPVMGAIERTLAAGIPRHRIGVYVLIGHADRPEDARYRLETLRSRGIRGFPMRFQPLDALRKDSYVAPGWTDRELRRMTRYWSRQNWLSRVPYEEFGVLPRSRP